MKDFLQKLTGNSDAPVVKVGIDSASLINLYFTLVFSAATIMLVYYLLFHKTKI